MNSPDFLDQSGFDDLTRLAAQLCDAPVAMLALVNRQRHYLKSLTGLDQQDSDRLLPLCAHAAQADDAVMIEDTLLHDWFSQHNMVTSAPYIRFFVAIPLTGAGGELTGNLCIIDKQPRTLCSWQINHLKILARQSVLLLELGRQQNNLRALAAHQENIKEQERQRIARDLHDELGQNLLALKLDLTMMLTPSLVSMQPPLKNAIYNLNSVISGLRNIINDLRPPVLELGLVASAEWQLKKFERLSQIRCVLDTGNTRNADLFDSLNTVQVATLFRILQEALTNVRRHAKASEVVVRLRHTVHGIEMLISDDGIGISDDALVKHQCYGLIGMRERLRASRGSLRIDTAPDLGTTLVIFMPLTLNCISA